MKKILIIGVILVVAAVGVGVYVVMSQLDSVVKAAVEQIGSDATGTQVSLQGVEISPTDGHGPRAPQGVWGIVPHTMSRDWKPRVPP